MCCKGYKSFMGYKVGLMVGVEKLKSEMIRSLMVQIIPTNKILTFTYKNKKEMNEVN